MSWFGEGCSASLRRLFGPRACLGGLGYHARALADDDPLPPDPPGASPQERLDSWKEIAAYLGRSPRTVQRWERTEGLPVHRLQHDKLGSVYAHRSELDDWWHGRRVSLQAASEDGPETLPEADEGPAADARGPRRAWLAAGAAVAVLALGLWGWRTWSQRGAPGAPTRLAVLPFDNLSGDPADEYLSAGFTEELIAELSRLQPERLRVVPRASVTPFKAAARPIASVRQELSADFVLVGSLRRAGERLRVTAQLVRATDESPVWADSYDGRVGEALSLQADVALRVAREVRVKLAPPDRDRLAARHELPSEAHQLYLRGRYRLGRGDVEDKRAAIDSFEQATRLAPTFAEAWAGLAEACVDLASFGYGGLTPSEALRRARPAAQRAIELDPGSSSAHLALGGVLLFADHDWAGAGRAYGRAVALNPGDSSVWQAQSLYLAAAGRTAEALAAARQAHDLDPLSATVNRTLGAQLYFARRYDEALAHLGKLRALAPDDVNVLDALCEIQWQRGDFAGFFDAFADESRVMGMPQWLEAARQGHARDGARGLSRALIDEIQRSPGLTSPYLVAELHARGGENELAIDWLEKAEAAGATQVVYSRAAPYFEKLHGHPRFEALLERIGP